MRRCMGEKEKERESEREREGERGRGKSRCSSSGRREERKNIEKYFVDKKKNGLNGLMVLSERGDEVVGVIFSGSLKSWLLG